MEYKFNGNPGEIEVKSGNKQKSIYSYINKIAQNLLDYNQAQMTAYDHNINKLVSILEIFKRNIEGLKHTIKIHLESIPNTADHLVKKSCMKIGLRLEDDYIAINQTNLKKLISNKAKRETPLDIKHKSKKEQEIDCINNINQFFK